MTANAGVAAIRIIAIGLVVLVVSFGVVAVTNALYGIVPAGVLRLGSVPMYAVWLVIGGLACAAWPALARTPWHLRVSAWTARDRAIVATAGTLALALYAPQLVRVITDGATSPRLDFIGGAVAAPFVEEWLFRGLVWNHLARAVRSERAAVILNLTFGSVIFGLYHLSFEGVSWRALANVLPHAEFGMLVGIVRWRTRSLLPGALIHLIGNFVARLAMP